MARFPGEYGNIHVINDGVVNGLSVADLVHQLQIGDPAERRTEQDIDDNRDMIVVDEGTGARLRWRRAYSDLGDLPFSLPITEIPQTYPEAIRYADIHSAELRILPEYGIEVPEMSTFVVERDPHNSGHVGVYNFVANVPGKPLVHHKLTSKQWETSGANMPQIIQVMGRFAHFYARPGLERDAVVLHSDASDPRQVNDHTPPTLFDTETRLQVGPGGGLSQICLIAENVPGKYGAQLRETVFPIFLDFMKRHGLTDSVRYRLYSGWREPA